MSAPSSDRFSNLPPSAASAYFREEHEMLRDQVARFIEEEVKPNGEAWEAQGHVPREGHVAAVLRPALREGGREGVGGCVGGELGMRGRQVDREECSRAVCRR